MTRRFCLAGLLAVLAHIAAAQPSRAQGLEAELMIGGITATCRDFRGIEVRTVQLDDIGDVARASIISRMPIISIDKSRMPKLSEKMQLFFYFHECAHHTLAHIFVPTINSENEADCWSVKQGRKRGFFTRDDVASFAPVFAHNRGSAAGHLPGPERSKHLLSCFDDPSDTDEPKEPAQTITKNNLPAGYR